MSDNNDLQSGSELPAFRMGKTPVRIPGGVIIDLHSGETSQVAERVAATSPTGRPFHFSSGAGGWYDPLASTTTPGDRDSSENETR